MSRRLRGIALLATNLVIGLAVLGWVLHRWGGPALDVLRGRAAPGWLVLFVATAALAFLAYTRRWQVLLAGVGSACGLGALAGFRAAGQTVSALVPSAKLGGEPLRALLLVRHDVPGAHAIASVAVDRVLEMGSASVFACLYAIFLLSRGVPALGGAMVTVALGFVALVVGVTVMVRRLRRGAGLVTAMARTTGLDRLGFVRGQLHVLGAAEEDAARLVGQPGRIARAFAFGVAANLIVLLEYHLLLFGFGLPAGPLAVVAAIFATGAAHSLPVPAAVGALEGAQMWLFGTLGHPPEVGLAVGLAVRLREVVWIVPGILYLLVRGVRPRTAAQPA
ncbi:MAG TPA: lysylphosphatidylglycerol synthase transmembrane domain-containing protein [Gaiellaceae bacterium]|nr:lysylphosphatidylglycerol synthase transmembrane domain-containing protein [Gaiellaceae bacterium]